MLFNGTGYNVLWLMSSPSGNRWVREEDATMADAGGTVFGPLDGVMVSPRTASVSVTYAGGVRSWKTSLPLRAGAQMLGTGYPLALSPAGRNMVAADGFAAGDAFRLWLGDNTVDASYANFTFQAPASWLATDGSDASATKLFNPFRAAWFISAQGSTSWVPPVPWAP